MRALMPKITSIPKIPSSGVCFGGIFKAEEQAAVKKPVSEKDKKIGRLVKRPIYSNRI
jgi:hypothetical protein